MKRLLVTLGIAAFVFSGFYGEAFAAGTGTTNPNTTNTGTYGTNGYGTDGYDGTTYTGRNYRGNYNTRATAVDGTRTDWGWLGLLGLVGLAGLTGRNRDRSNIK